MKKEEIYNEAIGGDEGFAPGEGYPSCDGQPCANVSGDDGVATDTMTDATPTGDEGPSDGAASGEAGEESGVEAGGSEQLAPELERRIAEWQDKYLRLQAEFDNYRKRTLREKMELVERGGADVIKAMLPVADDMDRAVEAMAGSDDIEVSRSAPLVRRERDRSQGARTGYRSPRGGGAISGRRRAARQDCRRGAERLSVA